MKYLLRAYLRVRLAKIEEFVLHIISSPGGTLLARLSPAEQQFATGYTDAVEECLRASVLSHLPPQFQSLLQQIEDPDDATFDMVPSPVLDGHVFCRVKQSRGNVSIDECAGWGFGGS